MRASVLVAFVASLGPAAASPASAQRALPHRLAGAGTDPYAVELVAPAAYGTDLNGSGDVIGTSYPDPGCGSFCLPPLETVVWRGAERIVLPGVPALDGVTVNDMNDSGWIVGFAGLYTTTHAVLWRPDGDTYEAIDLGTLPGTTISEAVGIDELGRVVGWSTTQSFPPNGSPFLWTEATGMLDLSLLGFPDEAPLAISPGGTVATASHWYRLDDPASVAPMAVPPSGYLLGSYAAAINDAGDQARFLVRTSGQNLVYLFRYHREGEWQLLSATPTGHLTRYGIGSIDANGTVTATVASTGVLARGPEGLASPLAQELAEPWVYPDLASTAVTSAGPMNARGEILAQVLLGRSPRLVRLVPAAACRTACMRVDQLDMQAVFVPDPRAPGSCAEELDAYDDVLVTVRVAAGGIPLPGIQVSGRFLDDYWANAAVTGTTDASGRVTFSRVGPCGVGAIEFLVDDAVGGGFQLDARAGRRSVWRIPQ